jgi:hypothetical protein
MEKNSEIKFIPSSGGLAVKLAFRNDPVKSGKMPVKAGVQFAPAAPGQPMNRQVKVIVWPSVPKASPPFPGQQIPTNAQECRLQASPPAESWQEPPRIPKRAPSESKIEDPSINVSVERMVFLQRVEKLMASEARIHELETESVVLRGTIGKFGAKVAELESQIEILKAKKG